MEDDFYDMDPEINKVYQREYDNTVHGESCQNAYTTIYEMGFAQWYWAFSPITFKRERKDKLILNMIKYFESIEEYEKCKWLKDSYDIEQTRNGIIDDDFYNWKNARKTRRQY